VKPNIGITKSTTTIKNRKQCSQIIQQMHAKTKKQPYENKILKIRNQKWKTKIKLEKGK